MILDGKKRSILRKKAQSLDPVITVGKNGLSEALMQAADEAFRAHELVKVRYTDNKDKVDELTDILAEKTGAQIAGKTGHTAILYRQNKDPEERKIVW